MRRFNARNKKIKQAITDDYPKRVQSKFYRLDVFFLKKRTNKKSFTCAFCVCVCVRRPTMWRGGGLTPAQEEPKKPNVDEKQNITNHHINHTYTPPCDSWAKAYKRFSNHDIIFRY